MAKPDDSYWDPMRQCEGLADDPARERQACREYTGLRLVPVTGADGRRSYHWFCELHNPLRSGSVIGQ